MVPVLESNRKAQLCKTRASVDCFWHSEAKTALAMTSFSIPRMEGAKWLFDVAMEILTTPTKSIDTPVDQSKPEVNTYYGAGAKCGSICVLGFPPSLLPHYLSGVPAALTGCVEVQRPNSKYGFPALAANIVLCSCARHFTLTAPLFISPGFINLWVPTNLMHRVSPQCFAILSLGKSMVVLRLLEKLRYSNERATKFESLKDVRSKNFQL